MQRHSSDPTSNESARVCVDGKFFSVGEQRFRFRGVTYGTFAPRSDGARYPDPEQIESDFGAMAASGFTVVRTYTVPPDDVLGLAADAGLRIVCDAFYPDWRYLSLARVSDLRRLERTAHEAVADAADRLKHRPEVLALSLGNEIPADAIRWFGTERVARLLDELAATVRAADPDLLVTYANYPTAEYLPLDALDFPMFNVYLEQRSDLRRYLTKLQTVVGDRPLVLGEIGLHAGDGEELQQRQADVLDWQLETAVERGVAGTCVFAWTDEWHVGDAAVEGWQFGLTTADRRPRQALDVVRRWNHRTVADLDYPWPSISVVICAYNAAATLDECLLHTSRLDYPDLEIVVVDDGSTDDTADIVSRYPLARLHSIPHGGLSVARNEGFRVSSGRVVAYLDSDAFPPPDWLHYLALGFDSHRVGGVGGPNVPPRDSSFDELVVARAPGGPVHVLTTDDRAEHVPGCNMAFYREVLAEVGGFDPIYVSAGDDVDLCWKVLDRDWEIAFHPAALVWHRRRSGLRPYLKQQLGYGRSEALVEARHPDRFTPSGTARWRGHIYDSFAPTIRGESIYRGMYGTSSFQSIYRNAGHAVDLLHQLGVPVAVGLLATAPLALAGPWWGVPAVAASVFLAVLWVIDVARCRPPRQVGGHTIKFRFMVAVHHILQPLVRTWGRARHRRPARADLAPVHALPEVVDRSGGIVLVESDRPRHDLLDEVVARLRRLGARTVPATGWESYDARVMLSLTLRGELVSSAYPEGFVQLRFRHRPRPWPTITAILVAALVALASPIAGLIVATVVVVEFARGAVRSRKLLSAVFGPAVGDGDEPGGSPISRHSESESESLSA